MNKSRFILVCSVLIFSMVYSLSYAKIPDNILKQKRAVITITYDDKDGSKISGSGFIIESDGKIVTNYHVISKWLETKNVMLIKMENGAFFPVKELLNFDEENDLAILKIEGRGLPSVKLAVKSKAKQGDKVITIGSPLGLETTVSEGIISSIRKNNLIQLTAPISPGSSGSPVFNIKGEVIGVATFHIEGGQNLNFAIPAKYVSELMHENETGNKKYSKLPLSSPTTDKVPDKKTDPYIEKINKADTLFRQAKYDDAMLAYILIWVDINKLNYPKESYILYQIINCCLNNQKDLAAWSWWKELKKFSSSPEHVLAEIDLSSKTWFYVEKGDDVYFYINFPGIREISGNKKGVMIKTVHRDSKYEIGNYIYDCDLKRFCIIGAMYYNQKGKNIRNHDFSDNIKWQLVPPGSIGESIWKSLCE